MKLVSDSFSCFLDFSWKIKSTLQKVTVLTVIISLYRSETVIKLFCLYCFLQEIFEKSSKENLTVIKHTFPNKSRNSGSLKKS